MSAPAKTLDGAVSEILLKRRQITFTRSLLVGVSGIDGSGKGYLTGQIVTRLRQHGAAATGVNVDGWLNLPRTRFSRERPAAHFYAHALWLDEMFSRLILPLRANRACDLVADFAEETAVEYRPHRYLLENIDIIVLEGIYLFKRAYRHHFDLAFWVDCTFETALVRALQCGQEGLPPDETVRAYRTIYFPAQRIHFARDNPRDSADFVINNDASLERVGVPGSEAHV